MGELDTFGYGWIRLDAFGHVWLRPAAFGYGAGSSLDFWMRFLILDTVGSWIPFHFVYALSFGILDTLEIWDLAGFRIWIWLGMRIG